MARRDEVDEIFAPAEALAREIALELQGEAHTLQAAKLQAQRGLDRTAGQFSRYAMDLYDLRRRHKQRHEREAAQ